MNTTHDVNSYLSFSYFIPCIVVIDHLVMETGQYKFVFFFISLSIHLPLDGCDMSRHKHINVLSTLMTAGVSSEDMVSIKLADCLVSF